MGKSVNIAITAKDHASAAFAKAGAAAGGFGSRLMSLKGLLAGALGGFALKATVEKAMAAWGEQEQASAKLAAVLETTGHAAGVHKTWESEFPAEREGRPGRPRVLPGGSPDAGRSGPERAVFFAPV